MLRSTVIGIMLLITRNMGCEDQHKGGLWAFLCHTGVEQDPEFAYSVRQTSYNQEGKVERSEQYFVNCEPEIIQQVSGGLGYFLKMNEELNRDKQIKCSSLQTLPKYGRIDPKKRGKSFGTTQHSPIRKFDHIQKVSNSEVMCIQDKKISLRKYSTKHHSSFEIINEITMDHNIPDHWLLEMDEYDGGQIILKWWEHQGDQSELVKLNLRSFIIERIKESECFSELSFNQNDQNTERFMIIQPGQSQSTTNVLGLHKERETPLYTRILKIVEMTGDKPVYEFAKMDNPDWVISKRRAILSDDGTLHSMVAINVHSGNEMVIGDFTDGKLASPSELVFVRDNQIFYFELDAVKEVIIHTQFVTLYENIPDDWVCTWSDQSPIVSWIRETDDKQVALVVSVNVRTQSMIQKKIRLPYKSELNILSPSGSKLVSANQNTMTIINTVDGTHILNRSGVKQLRSVVFNSAESHAILLFNSRKPRGMFLDLEFGQFIPLQGKEEFKSIRWMNDEIFGLEYRWRCSCRSIEKPNKEIDSINMVETAHPNQLEYSSLVYDVFITDSHGRYEMIRPDWYFDILQHRIFKVKWLTVVDLLPTPKESINTEMSEPVSNPLTYSGLARVKCIINPGFCRDCYNFYPDSIINHYGNKYPLVWNKLIRSTSSVCTKCSALKPLNDHELVSISQSVKSMEYLVYNPQRNFYITAKRINCAPNSDYSGYNPIDWSCHMDRGCPFVHFLKKEQSPNELVRINLRTEEKLTDAIPDSFECQKYGPLILKNQGNTIEYIDVRSPKQSTLITFDNAIKFQGFSDDFKHLLAVSLDEDQPVYLVDFNTNVPSPIAGSQGYRKALFINDDLIALGKHSQNQPNSVWKLRLVSKPNTEIPNPPSHASDDLELKEGSIYNIQELMDYSATSTISANYFAKGKHIYELEWLTNPN